MKAGTIFEYPIKGTDKTVKLIAVPETEGKGCEDCIFRSETSNCNSNLLGKRDASIASSCTENGSIIYKLFEDISSEINPQIEKLLFGYLSKNNVTVYPLEKDYKVIKLKERMFIDVELLSIVSARENTIDVFLKYKAGTYQFNISILDLLAFTYEKLLETRDYRFT